jgi:hypothetical protein
MFSGHLVMGFVLTDNLIEYKQSLFGKSAWDIFARLMLKTALPALILMSRSHYTIDLIIAVVIYELNARLKNAEK